MATKISAAMAASLASGGTESVGFLNDIIAELWDYINVTGATICKEVVEPMFADMLPGPLSSLHFTKIDLGSTPIKLDRIDVHRPDKDAIKLDVDIFWDGNCDIELAANLIGNFGVRQIKLGGRMSVLMTPLVGRLPLVTAVQIAFINPPKLRLDFTGLAEIAEFSLIEDTIYKIIDSVLASILVLPNRLLVKLDPTSVWYDTYCHPLGYLRLSVCSGAGFTVPKQLFKDIPDIYCNLRVGAHPVWTTSTVNNSTEPVWKDAVSDFLLSDHDQLISVDAFDKDVTSRDDTLGNGHITVGDLLLASRSKQLPLLIDTTDTGATIDIKCSILSLTSDLSSLGADDHAGDNLMCGLITVLIAGVRKLPVEREDAGSCIKLSMFGEDFSTPVVPDVPGCDAINPNYDAAFRVPLTNDMLGEEPPILFTLMNKKTKLGTHTVPFEDVRGADGATLTVEHTLGNGATILARIILHGVEIAE